MSGYSDGRRVEYAVMHDLTENGYECTRAASSKGVADVIAFKAGECLLVNVKRTTMPGPGERADLIRVASLLGGIAVPLVALKPLRYPLTYRRLTGLGPKDWTCWLPDEVDLGAQVDVPDDGGDSDPWDGPFSLQPTSTKRYTPRPMTAAEEVIEADGPS